MDKLHKMVNGKKVFLSNEEEKNVREEWERNKKEHEEYKRDLLIKKEKRNQVKKKLAKLLDVEDNEIDFLFKSDRNTG